MEFYAKDKDPKKDCRRYGHLEGKKCSSSGKNGRQVVGGEAKQVDAPSLYKIIKASEMLVAPRISECFGLGLL